jgi:hypothetical protein
VFCGCRRKLMKELWGVGSGDKEIAFPTFPIPHYLFATPFLPLCLSCFRLFHHPPARCFIGRGHIGESGTRVWLPGIGATPHTGSPVASANMSQLAPKARSRSQSQCRPPDMRGTLAIAPGRRPEISTRRRRGNAERRSADSALDPRRLCSNDERSRAGLLRIDVG